MKMTGIEKGVLAAIGVLLALLVVSAILVSESLSDAFGDCRGLKNVVEKVWEGTECSGE